jgi:PAS domain S-box-containing protein
MAPDSSADSGRPVLSPAFSSLNSQDIFSSLLDTLEDPFFLLDDAFRFTWHNKACNDLYHAVSGKDIGNDFDFNILLTDEQQSLFRQHLDKVAAGENVHFEWKYQMTFIKWLSVSLYPFRSSNGIFSGICGSLRDITGKKIAERVLLRNTAVLNNIGEGVLLVDTQFRVLTFNKQAIRIFHRLNAIVHTGADFLTLLPEHRRSPVRQNLQKALSGTRIEYEIAYPDDLWLFISYLPVANPGGNIEQVSISFRDISERKKAEEQVRTSEVKYKALVNSLSEGVILQTLDKQILTVNKSALAILGLGADMLKEKGFPSPDLILVDEHEKEISHEDLFYKRNGQLHGVRNKVFGIRRISGIQWLKLNSAVVANARQKDPYTIVISFEDITRQKKISGEMEVLALLARETVNAVIILHPDGEMLWMNEGFSRLTGYSSTELIGQSTRAFLLGPDTDMNTVKKAAYCRQNGLPFLEEFLIYTKTGKKVWTRVQGQSIMLAKGKVPNYFLIITDITEEKKIRQELEVLSLVAKETNNGVVFFDKLSGNTLWINEGFTRLTGYAPADILGKDHMLTLQGPDTNKEQLRSWTERISNNLSYGGDLIMYTRNGQKRILHITGQPFKNEKGDVTRYFAIGYDVTEQRRMEEERLQNEIEQQKRITRVILETQELERNLLGRELHDNINQILAAIRMQLSYCIENFDICQPVLTQSRENIIEAIEETRRLSHRMVMPRFSERSLPHELKKLAGNYQHTQVIYLHTAGWTDEQVAIPVKEAFFRIVQEQMSNIYKHANATKVTIRITSDAGNAVLSVEDNGKGFDPGKKKGGIGLSNIHSRAESCNGTARFISAPGAGCTLLVNIPLH